MSLWIAAALVLITAIVVLLLVVMHKRRRTPRLQIDVNALPEPEQMLPLLSGLTGSAVYRGNRAEIFQNGALFSRIDQDIDGARYTIHIETFVWTAGRLSRCVVDRLAEKARQGVKVRLLIDAMGGSRADSAELDLLREAGAEVAIYCSPSLGNWRRFNHRSHRKLVVIDGHIGYTCGHGVADQWLGDAEDAEHWRDTGARLTGPVVHGLQAVFFENWIEETFDMPTGEGCFPELEETGSINAHVVSSASGDALSTVSMTYTIAIAAARREVLIQNPYFVPDRGMVDLLCQRVRDGVTVKMILPGTQTDSPFVRRAGCHLYDELLRSGVRIFEYQPTLCHQKIMIVDGIWSHVGSTNFDARSLELNEEISVGLIDGGIATTLIEAFEQDLRHSRELSLDNWRCRPRRHRMVESVAYWLHEQL